MAGSPLPLDALGGSPSLHGNNATANHQREQQILRMSCALTISISLKELL